MSNRFQTVATVLAITAAALVAGCKSAAVEPTEDEMRAAAERAYANAGTGTGKPGELRIDNPLSGVSVSFKDFEKLSCAPAVNKPGFVCDYMVTTSMGFHSNMGSAGGDAHAKAVGDLMSFLNGGRTREMRQAVTDSIIQSKGEWMMLSE